MKNLSPHKAIIQIQVITSVHPMMYTGECKGSSMSLEELNKYGIPANMILAVSGKDTVECVKSLKPKLAKIKELFDE